MMLALELYRSVPRYVAARAAGSRLPGLLIGPMAPIRLLTRSPPKPSRPGWVSLRPRLAGVCGSDLGAVTGTASLYFSALTSMPFVPGHEVVGELLADCEDLPAGTRVVIDPVLACAARGTEPCPQCVGGRTNLCDRITVGHVSPGLQTGFCADTGGGWGEQLIVHRSQLHVVPDRLPDERAVLVEPLACAVRLAQQADVPARGSVLVSGAGTVGLFAVLALRQLTSAARITVVAKHAAQATLARLFGATDVVAPAEAMGAVRRRTRALRVGSDGAGVPPRMRQEMLLGGVDVTVDAVGSTASLELALRTTRAGGRVVLAGMPPAKVDLSPAWFRELQVVGTYATSGRAFNTALELAGDAPLDGLVGGQYPLHRWREALDHAYSAGRLGTVKVCFNPKDSKRRQG